MVKSHYKRRSFLFCALASTAVLTGCVATSSVKTRPVMSPFPSKPLGPPDKAAIAAHYAALDDGGYQLPAVPFQKIDPKYYPQRVANTTGEPAGTVVVDVPSRLLYLVEPGGTAMRYGVGLGRAGFSWAGEGVIRWRQKWPRWKPPAEMIARQPELEKYSVDNGGQEPGPDNPLGARALYIFQNGKDTLYRIHGTKSWSSIGKAVSSGCVRMINQDVIDLYSRVPSNARIIVRQ